MNLISLRQWQWRNSSHATAILLNYVQWLRFVRQWLEWTTTTTSSSADGGKKKKKKNVKKNECIVLSTFDENICSSFSLSLCRFHFVFRFYSLFAIVVIIVVAIYVCVYPFTMENRIHFDSFILLLDLLFRTIRSWWFFMRLNVVVAFFSFPFIHLSILLYSQFFSVTSSGCALLFIV